MRRSQGPIEHLTVQEWIKAVEALRHRLLLDRQRAFTKAIGRQCPVCGKRGLNSRDDLVRETIRGPIVLVHHNLHGARCAICGSESLEAYEQVALEESDTLHRIADHQAKVTSVSGRNLGTYWPRDVVRVMDLHDQDPLRVQIVDEDTMIVRRVPAAQTE